MKRLLKRILRVISLALALTIAFALYPYARDWLKSHMPQGKYERISTLLTHELQEAGELTAVRFQDTGVMHTETNALFLGSVQEVTVPYAYEIGLGFPLSEVTIQAQGSVIQVSIPEIRMLYDSFQVTGEPEVRDFWYQLTESRYQKMLDDQAKSCREAYQDPDLVKEAAWDAACKALESLFSQWADESLILSFVPAASPAPI